MAIISGDTCMAMLIRSGRYCLIINSSGKVIVGRDIAPITAC